ncbi:MAG: hypothetical protein DRH06_00035 [Deltaproteobacteria bacterium]|nr:MAG: hypothetical protein DRH06_00035 [Deltaproteobacteria bacterium]
MIGIIVKPNMTVATAAPAPGVTVEELLALIGEGGYAVPRTHLPDAGRGRYQEAWRFNETTECFTMDLPVVKTIAVATINGKLQRELHQYDPALSAALDAGNITAEASVRADRNYLRNIARNKIIAINLASTFAQIDTLLPA